MSGKRARKVRWYKAIAAVYCGRKEEMPGPQPTIEFILTNMCAALRRPVFPVLSDSLKRFAEQSRYSAVVFYLDFDKR